MSESQKARLEELGAYLFGAICLGNARMARLYARDIAHLGLIITYPDYYA